MTAITPVLIAKVQAAQDRRRASTRPRHGAAPDSSPGIQDPYYEWHRSTEAALDYAVTFDIRPESGPIKGVAKRRIAPMLRLGKSGKIEMEFKGEFLEFRIYRDGELIEPIMPGRLMIAGDADENHRFVDQAHAGNYVYSPAEFLTGKEFRVQIFDASNPNTVHKELIFNSDSPLIKQLRADFALAPGILLTQAP